MTPLLFLAGGVLALAASIGSSIQGHGRLANVLAVIAVSLVAAAWSLERRARSESDAALERSAAARADRDRSTKLVLDNSEHGFVVIDSKGTMMSEVPAVVESWLGAVPASGNLGDYLLRHNRNLAESFVIGLEQLADQSMPTEVSIAQLPTRLVVGTRVIALAYRLVDRPGEPASWLFVTMSDMSAQLGRERGDAATRDLLGIFGMIRSDRQAVINFLQEGSMIIEELSSVYASNPTVAKRLVHTLKGNASQFGMTAIANVCHELEGRLGQAFTAADFLQLLGAWSAAAKQVGELVGGGADKEMTIDLASYRHVVGLVQQGRPREEVLAAMGDWGRDPVQARLEGLGTFAKTLGRELGKDGLETTCDGNGHRLDYADWASFWTACVHVIRNAVDHGIEDAAVRVKQGKSPAGRLYRRAEIADQRFTISIADDGRGINWSKLATKAAEEEMPFDTDAQRVEVLFCDGMSTKTQVSSVSGRGVGLSAFRAEVVRRRGTVEVTTVPGAGTTFTARFPIDHMAMANTP